MANDSHIIGNVDFTENHELSSDESQNSGAMDLSFSDESFNTIEGQTDNEYTSNTNSQEHDNVVTPDVSDDSDTSFEESFILDIDEDEMNDIFVDHEYALAHSLQNLSPIQFVTDRSLLTHPQHKTTYFEHLSTLSFTKIFEPFFSKEMIKHVEHPNELIPSLNLIDFLDVEGHGLLVQALGLSNKLAFIKDNKDEILNSLDPENYSDLIKAFGFSEESNITKANIIYSDEFYKSHSDILNDVGFIKEHPEVLIKLFSDLFESLTHYYNIDDIPKEEVWEQLLIVLHESSKLRLNSVINNYINIIPPSTTQIINNQLVSYNIINTENFYRKITQNNNNELINTLPMISHIYSTQPVITCNLIKHHFYLIKANEKNISWSNINQTFTALYTILDILVTSERVKNTKTSLKNKLAQISTSDVEAQLELEVVNMQLSSLYKLHKVMSIFTQHYIKISNEKVTDNTSDLATTPRYIPAQLADVSTDTLQLELSKLSLRNRVVVSPDKENNNQLASLPAKRKITFFTPEQKINRNIPQISPSQNFDDEDMLISKQLDRLQSPCKKLRYYELNLFDDRSPRHDSDSNIIESDAQFDL